MIDRLATGATALTLLALGAAPLHAQAGGGLPPLIDGLDEFTVALGQFEGNVGMLGQDGPNLVKSTGGAQVPGIYGNALQVPLDGVVQIYESAGFESRQGTLEMWVRIPPAVPQHARTLFSLEGVNTLDGDAYNDLFVGQAVNGDPVWSEVHFGTPDGPSDTDVALIKTFMPRGVNAGDVDGDGRYDLVVAQNQIDEVHIFKGPIRPGFVYDTPVDPSKRVSVPVPQGMGLGDLDNDGDLDLLVSSYDAETAPIYGFENDGKGRFSALEFEFGPVTAFAEGMAMGDVNRDGLLDVVYASLDTAVPSGVFLGQIVGGDYAIGILDPSMFSSRSAAALGVSMADVDEDGWLDVLLARTFDNEVAVHLNRGNGAFFPVASFTIPCTRPFTVAATEDVNNDGFLDVAVAQWKDDLQTTTESRIFLGPDYTASLAFDVQDAVSMTLGDVDGDGADEIFWRSSTAVSSPFYSLDVDGNVVGLTNIDTTITVPGTAGPGMGVFASIAGGTSPYSTVLDQANSFDLYLDGEELVFAITDRRNARHELRTAFPAGGEAVSGWRHVTAEWAGPDGYMSLRVLPDQGDGSFVERTGDPIRVTLVHPWMRLASDPSNQNPCRNCRFDDVRVSTVRRSQR